MKKILLLLSIYICSIGYSQNFNSTDWENLKYDSQEHFTVTKTEKFEIDSFLFDVVWDSKLYYSENIGYYGGIKILKIYKNNQLLDTIKNIEDGIALGEIYFNFYDYNLDGYLDFTIPITCGKICWLKYYIFNPQKKKYEHLKDWDYLRIQKINKIKKQILSEPDDLEMQNIKLYQIKGLKLIELK